jgi:hypothetical protein
MDKFRAKQNNECDVGGVKCRCCNGYHDKDKPMLNQIARSKLKQEDRKEIEEEIINDEESTEEISPEETSKEQN